jgi:hypothetical protein
MNGEKEPVAWLRAQVEARLAVARMAAREGGMWTQDDPERRPGSIESLGGPVVYDEGAPDEYQAAHIALNDPQDTIARCEAELAILDLHKWVDWDDEHYSGTGCITCDYQSRGHVDRSGPRGAAACLTVRLLAGAYRHRPGYRGEDWKPQAERNRAATQSS